MDSLFVSPSQGKLTLREVVREVVLFISEENRRGYRLIIGTDSASATLKTPFSKHQVNHGVDFVNAIVIHRVGRGGRYFWRRMRREYKKPLELKARIFTEANLSVGLAVEFLALLQQELANAFIEMSWHVEVHIDIGQNGPTKDMIKELVGMVKGSGFEAHIKPEAYAASCVADKYT